MSKKEIDRSSEAERLRRFTKRLLDDVRALRQSYPRAGSVRGLRHRVGRIVQ